MINTNYFVNLLHVASNISFDFSDKPKSWRIALISQRISRFIKLVKKGQVEKARKLLKKGANPNVQDKNGYTLLHNSENYKVIQPLLSYGANVNATSKCGNTPLHFAAIRMNIQKMAQLLNCGADPNILNNRHDTALHHVLMNYGRKDQDALLEGINILTDFGAEIDNQDYNAETALYLAVMGIHTKRMKSPPKTVL